MRGKSGERSILQTIPRRTENEGKGRCFYPSFVGAAESHCHQCREVVEGNDLTVSSMGCLDKISLLDIKRYTDQLKPLEKKAIEGSISWEKT